MNIKIYPSHCKVEGTFNEMKWLKDLLTYDVPGAKFSKQCRMRIWDGKKRFFNLVTKMFPIGFLDIVLREGKDMRIHVEDTRIFPKIDISMPEMKVELRDYQKQAILDCLKYKNCIVRAATNSGKTVIFAGVIKKLYPLETLILIHREEILTQIKEMVEDAAGIKVGIITSKDTLIRPVTVAMVTTLTNRIGVDQEITDYFNKVKCIISDECHHLKAKQLSNLLSASKAVFRMGFSGTVPEEGTYDGMLVRQWVGSVIFEIGNDELISMGVSAKPLVTMYEIDLTERLKGIFDEAKEQLSEVEYTGQELMKKVYQLSIQKGIVENDERNFKAVEICKNNVGKSVLVIVDFLAHGKRVEEMLNLNGINAVFISGESDVRQSALELFKAGKLKVLISTSILDEGVDISHIEVLVLLAGKKSKRQLLQRVGRSLRKKEGENTVQIFDFLDFGNRYLKKHSAERLKIYNDEKFEVKFIN